MRSAEPEPEPGRVPGPPESVKALDDVGSGRLGRQEQAAGAQGPGQPQAAA